MGIFTSLRNASLLEEEEEEEAAILLILTRARARNDLSSRAIRGERRRGELSDRTPAEYAKSKIGYMQARPPPPPLPIKSHGGG